MSAPPRLHRRLSRRDLLVYGLLFIGPLAPVGVFGVLDARTSGAVALVYVVATVAMAFTAWSYAQMSRVVPDAGSVFAYATRALGPTAGFFTGWLAMLDYVLIPAVAYLFSGIALHALVPAVPAWLFTVMAFGVATSLNVAGVQVAARAGFVVLLAELLVLAVFLLAGAVVLWQGGGVRPWASPFIGVDAITTADVMQAVSIAVLSFLGFDAIASFSEEAAGDTRQVGQAIGWCLVVAGLAFVAQTWMAAVLSATPPASLAVAPRTQATAFYDVTRAALGGWLATVVAVTKAIGPMFAAMTGQAAAARLVFGMAREGRLPARLSQVEARAGVPRTALLSTSALTVAVSVWAARQADGLATLVSIVDVGALAAFLLLHVSVVAYFRFHRLAPAGWWHLAIPVAGVVTCAWVLIEASARAQVAAVAWTVVGLAVWATGRRSNGLSRE